MFPVNPKASNKRDKCIISVKILGAPKNQRASNYNNHSNAKAQANSHVLSNSNIMKLYQCAIDTNSQLAPIAVASLIRLSNR